MTSFLVPYLLIALNQLNMSMLPMNKFELPKTWTKDFTIRYRYSGSMSGSRTEITFSYDSCTYTIQPANKAPYTGAFEMTETDRTEILKRMHELKVNKVKSDMSIGKVYDGWSQSLSLGNHWIQGGTSARMSDRDKEIFSDACIYLQEYVARKEAKK